MTKRKICGMREARNILDVAGLMPDYMGFIFYPGSPRFVGKSFAIPEALPRTIGRVGVFADQPVGEVIDLISLHEIDVVQLHGAERPDDCEALRTLDVKVVKAIGVSDKSDLGRLHEFESVVDYFLLDAKGVNRGGNGVPFDWNLLVDYLSDKPFWLAGGISKVTVNELRNLDLPKLHTLDINSGVESFPGQKDIGKITELFDKLDLMSQEKSL
ncbi:MAG: phosphoribosylanthranilate isomerase [Cytophagales bacterium]|nr:phosphoribosylanthranilate isomerase [Cytophagales bacterium]